MTAGLVLSLCDRTGVMVQPWLEAGYRCLIVDLQHPEGEHTDGLLTRVGADITTWLPPRGEYAAAFAFPPCTHLAGSGARWFRDKGLPALIDGLTLVEASRRLLEWTGAPWALENPSGTLSTYWRPPDFAFDPYEYGAWVPGGADAYTKRTHLWTGGGFVMPPRRPVEPVDGSKMHRLPPSAERANLRSVTPEGFARAVFAANHGERLPDSYGHEGQADLFAQDNNSEDVA